MPSRITLVVAWLAAVTRVSALMKLMSSLIVDLKDPERCEKIGKELPTWIENLFLFSLIWSVGGVIDGPSRPKFDAFFRQICSGKAPRGYEKVDGVFGEQAPFAKFFPEQGDATVYGRSLVHDLAGVRREPGVCLPRATLLLPSAEVPSLLRSAKGPPLARRAPVR